MIEATDFQILCTYSEQDLQYPILGYFICIRNVIYRLEHLRSLLVRYTCSGAHLDERNKIKGGFIFEKQQQPSRVKLISETLLVRIRLLLVLIQNIEKRDTLE